MAENTKAVTTETTIATTPKSRKVPAGAIRRLNNAHKKAAEKLAKEKVMTTIEKDAHAGLEAVRKIVPKKQDGKLSRFGHLMSCQNGQLDEALITLKGGEFVDYVRTVIKAECKSRKSDLNDNEAAINRMYSHLRTLNGEKPGNLRRALTRVELQHKEDEIASYLTPFVVMFKEYTAAGKW